MHSCFGEILGSDHKDSRNDPDNNISCIQPAVAQGNVGELAIDILIASLQATRVGTLEHEDVLPCCGNDPHDLSSPGCLSTSLELFEVPLPPGQ